MSQQTLSKKLISRGIERHTGTAGKRCLKGICVGVTQPRQTPSPEPPEEPDGLFLNSPRGRGVGYPGKWQVSRHFVSLRRSALAHRGDSYGVAIKTPLHPAR